VGVSNSWRNEASRRFPQFAASLTEADTPYLLWFDLLGAFESAYDRGDESLIEAIYAYAKWCCCQPRGKSADDDLATCVTVSFYEHIPTYPKALKDMPRWWSREEVMKLKEVFSYLAGEKTYAALLELYC